MRHKPLSLGNGVQRQAPLVLHSQRPNERDDAKDMTGKAGLKGYYRRPSRAIERGGGFFVPGLEGERIRLLTAVTLVAMFSVNRSGQIVTSLPQIVSETVGLIMALILFLQGVAELFPDEGGYLDIVENGTLPPAFVSTRQSVKSLRGIETLEQISRLILQTCVSVTYVAVVSSTGEVLIELGPVTQDAQLMTEVDGAVLSAVAKQTTTEGLDKDAFVSTVASADPSVSAKGGMPVLACLPSSVQSLALRVGDAGNAWVIGSTDENPKGSLLDQARWIDSLVEAPSSHA